MRRILAVTTYAAGRCQLLPRAWTTVPVIALVTALSWQLGHGVPLRQAFRMFADNSYGLDVANDTDHPVTLYVGFEHDLIRVAPGRPQLVRSVADESVSFPISRR